MEAWSRALWDVSTNTVPGAHRASLGRERWGEGILTSTQLGIARRWVWPTRRLHGCAISNILEAVFVSTSLADCAWEGKHIAQGAPQGKRREA